MKMIIDIPDKEYNEIKNGGNFVSTELCLLNAVTNGVPLSKGHGRLIDADYFSENKRIIIEYTYNTNYVGKECEIIDFSYIEDTPTIIEADKDGD